MTFAPSMQDLRFEYEQYLLEWVDCGGEPMTFEQFALEQQDDSQEEEDGPGWDLYGYDEDAALESYSLECCFGPEE